jgi:ubiquinone/menaquinone biosynthesis C-methylase UbiE
MKLMTLFVGIRCKIKKFFFGKTAHILNSNKQDLGIYWQKEMGDILENWGVGNTWHEIQLLMVNCNGRVLDVACGTGRVITMLEKNKNIDMFGCDISDYLIDRAISNGISCDKLTVCDATKTGYSDEQFNYSYSIGSLEHFTIDGIDEFVKEMHRITKYKSIHMVPVSRSNINEGWLKTMQSYHNNSVEWWYEYFKRYYYVALP